MFIRIVIILIVVVIHIDIPNRSIHLEVDDDRIAERRKLQDELGWKPEMQRPRKVSLALKAYGLMATSADKGAVRDLSVFL